MAPRKKKPPSDDAILADVQECGNDLTAVAGRLGLTQAALTRRLKAKGLKSRYRGLIFLMAGGNVSVAAKHLGLNRTYLHKLLNEDSKHFDAVVAEGWAVGRETRLDNAESKLDANIDKGKEASIFFLLKTLGKDRGYVERQEITGKDGDPVSQIEVIFVSPDD
ncbi:MAG: LysR family transcriptional regulator [Sphingomonadales bacterium]